MDFEITDTLNEADVKWLGDGLDEHGALLAPPRIKQDLGIFYRENGRLLAGLRAVTYWDWLHIRSLWVDDSLRGQGIGQKLMAAAEKEGAARGCHSAMVDTHSFQAPAFYKKAGYEVWGELADFPRGHTRIYFRKKLQ